jgi:hypothetical protein
MRSTRLSDLEEEARNDEEAHELLALIDSEFRTDPMSVRCFDLRIVERVGMCVAKRRQSLARRGFVSS